MLALVSPDCRAAMEDAATGGEAGMELSDSCRTEIQQALQSVTAGQDFSMPPEMEDEAQLVAPSGSATTTAVAVLIFLVLLFAGAGAFVVYVYRERKDFFKEKPEKKLSRAKIEKKRIQESRKQK